MKVKKIYVNVPVNEELNKTEVLDFENKPVFFDISDTKENKFIKNIDEVNGIIEMEMSNRMFKGFKKYMRQQTRQAEISKKWNVRKWR